MSHRSGPPGEAPVLVKKHKEREKNLDERDLIVAFVGKIRQDRLNSLGLASLNNSGQIWPY